MKASVDQKIVETFKRVAASKVAKSNQIKFKQNSWQNNKMKTIAEVDSSESEDGKESAACIQTINREQILNNNLLKVM